MMVSWDTARDVFMDNLLVRIHLVIVMIRWTGLAPWEFEFPFSGSLTFTFLKLQENPGRSASGRRGTRGGKGP